MRTTAGLLALLVALIVVNDTRIIAAPPGADGVLTLEIADNETGEPIPSRVELFDSRGRAVSPRGFGLARHFNHFYVGGDDNGSVEMPLKKGAYTFSIDAGVEYKPQSGSFEIERHADDSKQVRMTRFADLAKEGWYSGDIGADRNPQRDLDVVLRAEGLSYVPLIAYRWGNGQWDSPIYLNRVPDSSDESPKVLIERSVIDIYTPGGRLIGIAPGPLSEPPDWQVSDSLSFITAAKADGYLVFAASPVEWEFPAWVVTGKLDGVVLFANTSANANAKTGHQRPADRVLYGGAKGAARWHEAAYFQTLNAGAKLPPFTASDSLPIDRPLGAARTHVCCDSGFSREVWWQNALAGASVVSTGPLLRPRVGDDPPGQVFATSADEPVEFSIALNLATRTTVEYLEILRNGEIETEVRLADWAAAKGKLPPLKFDRSGWFAVRAVTTASDRYDVALTAPYYVQSPEGPRVSRDACRFFVDWLDELAKLDASHRTISDDHLAKARGLWEQQLGRANVD